MLTFENILELFQEYLLRDPEVCCVTRRKKSSRASAAMSD